MTLVYFLRLTLFISKYMGSIKKQPVDCWFHITAFVHQVTRISHTHTRLVPWSQGGSSSRLAATSHLRSTLVLMRVKDSVEKETITTESSLREYIQKRLTLIRLHRTIEVHFFPLCCMEIKAEFCVPDIRMYPVWICGLTLPSLYKTFFFKKPIKLKNSVCFRRCAISKDFPQHLWDLIYQQDTTHGERRHSDECFACLNLSSITTYETVFWGRWLPVEAVLKSPIWCAS